MRLGPLFAAPLLLAGLAGQTPASQTAASGKPAAPAAAAPLPAGPGQELVANTCTQCHDLDVVTAMHQSRDQWQTTVATMNDRGAGLSPADLTTVVDYLAKNFGPSAGPAAAAPDPLPEGPGKALVADACTACHTLDRIVSRKMDRAGWQGTVDDMLSRGADLTPEEETEVVTYLTAHFGKPAAPPAGVPGGGGN